MDRKGLIDEMLSDAEIAKGAYLNRKESWTAIRRYIARTFLLAGVIIGCPMGIAIAFAINETIKLLAK